MRLRIYDEYNSEGIVEFENGGQMEIYPSRSYARRWGTRKVKHRAVSNPSSGTELMQISSAGGSDRIRVEHDGVTSTTNALYVEHSYGLMYLTSTDYYIRTEGGHITGRSRDGGYKTIV
jgi:hypothetical protein